MILPKKLIEKVEEIGKRMLVKFPNAEYTIFTTLWQDNDFKLKCQYGEKVDWGLKKHFIEYSTVGVDKGKFLYYYTVESYIEECI